jgi:GPH family glycoside/pentoside/hexuronide:cation symporter
LGAYFLLVAVVYYTAYALFSIPWGALGLELSSDSRERMRVQAYRNAMQAFGGIFLGSLWWLSFKFGNGDEVRGVHDGAILFGVLIMIAGLTAAFSAKERIEVQSQAKISLLPAIGDTLRNRQFLSVCGIVLLALIGITIVLPFSLYINIYYIFGGQKEPVSSLNMVMNLIFQVLSIGFTPVVSGAAARIGKKKTLIYGLILAMLGNLVSWWAFRPGWPYLQIVISLLHAIGMASIWIIIPSMIADLCDWDEYHTGLRREGMYNATYAWITKAGVSAAFILSGYLVNWSGLDSALKVQPDEVVIRMRLLYMLVTPAFLAGALILAMKYSLTEIESARLRSELDRRRRDSVERAEELEPGSVTA